MMERKLISKVLAVQGMSCPSCEMKIENALRKIKGVVKVKASLAKSQVTVEYDPDLTESLPSMMEQRLADAVIKLGYEVGSSNDDKSEKKTSINQLLGVGIIIFAYTSLSSQPLVLISSPRLISRSVTGCFL